MVENQRAFAGKRGAQIALEFMIVYSVIILIFIIIFALIANERAATLAIQEYSYLQLLTQDIASYINYAVSAGDGYQTVISLPGIAITPNLYQLYIASDGVIKTQVKVGLQTISAVAYSVAKGMVINGTLVQSSSSVQVYNISTYRGMISITNSKGTIYINMQPASVLALPGTISIKQLANIKAANFNGQNSYVQIPNVNSLQLSTLTLTGWVNYRGQGIGPYNWLAAKQNAWSVGVCGSSLNVCFYDWGSGVQSTSSNTLTPGQWYFLAATIGSGIETVYLNGQNVLSNSLSVANQLTTGLQIGYGNSWDSLLNGYAADVQVYNTVLTANQIQALYQEGISGAPNNALLAGWWPLNGNANDYSGNGNQGTPYNINYLSTAQFSVHVASNSGANSVSDPLGLIASKGILQPNQNSLLLYTNATGNQTLFLVSGTTAGPSLLSTYAFNGNLTTAGSLVGWWPLTLGYGTTAYDLSGTYNNANLINVAWQPLAYQTNFQTASFNNVNSIVSGSANSATSNGLSVNAITLTAWVNNTGTGSYIQNIAEVSGGSAAPATLGLGVASAGGNLKLLWSNQAGTIQNSVSGGAIPANTQMFVAGVWNGTNNMLSIYINGTLTANTLGNGTTSTMVSDFNMGGAYSSMYGFNGLISNVQIYKSALSQQQIGSLYSQGPTGTPIAGSSMIGWWPLDGSANDYGMPAYPTTLNNVGFVNTQYAALNSSTKVAGFNGVSSYIEQQSGYGFMSSNAAQPFSISVWVDPSSANGIIVDELGQSAPDTGWHYSWMELVGGNVYMGVNGISCVSLGSISTNVWSNIVMTYNGNGVNGYINGVFENGESGTRSVPGSGAMYYPLGVGDSQNCGSGAYYNGKMANYQFYNTALTSQQVQQLYLQGMQLNQNVNVSFGGG